MEDQTLAKEVYDLLLDELITWRLRPGDIIAEGRLAKRLGTSRTPVRESLKVLTEEGFLRVIPRTGYVVVPVTVADIHEVSHMRLLLESEAAALAAERMSQDAIDKLRCCSEEVQRTASEQQLAGQVYDYNAHFHLSIAYASGNKRLAAAIEKLLKEEARVMFHDETVKDVDFVVGEHLKLLDVISTGEPKRARSAMRRHIEGHQERLLASLSSEQVQIAIGSRAGR